MKPFSFLLLPLVATVALTATVQAQAPGGRPGGPPPSPAMMAKFQAWRHFRDTHKNVSALQQSLRAIGQMEKDPKTKLNKKQAHAVLAVINKWKSKPALTDAQAREVNTQLTAPLSLAQIKQIAIAGERRRGGPGGGGPGGGGPGGGGPGGARRGGPGGPGGGGRMNPASFPSPREYNPLNPATSPMTRGVDRAKKEMHELMSALAATK